MEVLGDYSMSLGKSDLGKKAFDEKKMNVNKVTFLTGKASISEKNICS